MKWLLCLFVLVSGYAKQTICLNMIVKNEAEVIEICLASVKPLIDYWVIFDTGSRDGTQAIIKSFLKDVPGELHERPWVNFAHNRNEVLLASKGKGDYLLFVDADEQLQFDRGFALPELEHDVYHITLRQLNAADSLRVGLANNRFNWKWEGVLHETLVCKDARTSAVLKGVKNVCASEGARAKDPKTRLKDALMLEDALKQEPNNSRYVFYLGVSYSAAEEYEKALAAFEKRARMPSADIHETYLSIYNCGLCHEKRGDFVKACEAFFKANAFYPTRGEPLFRLAVNHRRQGKILLGYLLAKEALLMPFPEGAPCVEYTAYDYGMLVEFANCALLAGKWKEGLDASLKLLDLKGLPNKHRAQVVSNVEIAKKKLQK